MYRLYRPATSARFPVSCTTSEVSSNKLKNINTSLRNLPDGKPALRTDRDKSEPAAKIVSQDVKPNLPLRSTTGY
jgi:hypothetical protein